MPGFNSPEGDLTANLFLSETEIIDNAAGGSLFSWGFNGNYELGDGTTATAKSSPVQTIAGGTNWKQYAGGSQVSCAIKTDGTLWAWGANTSGQIGDNTTSTRSSPVQTVAGGTNWKQVSAGYRFCAAIKTDGTLWAWGGNNYGQLGDNTVGGKSSPIQTVTGGTNWKLVACGDGHTAAIKTDGTLWSWGRNDFGALGDNTSVSKGSPVTTVTGGNNWKQVACGNLHTAAIKTDGTLWSWGRNDNSQIGNNGATDTSSPIQTIAGGTNWKQVSCGDRYTAAIKTDGTLWLWGRNDFGQLGDSSITGRGSPVTTVTGGNNWKQVACAQAYTAAIKTDGTLWSWGRNDNGQLGDTTTTRKSSPVQIVAGGTNWKTLAVRNYDTTAAIQFSVALP